MKLSFAFNQILLHSNLKGPILTLTPRYCMNCVYQSNYESSISLKKLYPSSSLRLTTINKVGYYSIDDFKNRDQYNGNANTRSGIVGQTKPSSG